MTTRLSPNGFDPLAPTKSPTLLPEGFDPGRFIADAELAHQSEILKRTPRNELGTHLLSNVGIWMTAIDECLAWRRAAQITR